MGFKKKLYAFRPKEPVQEVDIHKTKERRTTSRVTSVSVERTVRELLADRVSGTYVGLWLLVPEHLRLGTWDVLKAWTGSVHDGAPAPRLALQMVHESAACSNGIRRQRTLRHKGFELLNGLPFVATDHSLHALLDRHTVEETACLQVSLGHLRRAHGHYPGRIILLDPHRLPTWTHRDVQPRKATPSARARKTLQTFFAVDAESGQPLACGIGSSAVTVSQATPSLVDRLTQILPHPALLIADAEHFTLDLISLLASHERFTFLIPVTCRRELRRRMARMAFTPCHAGYAVAEEPYPLARSQRDVRLIVQRTGETADSYVYKPFVTSDARPAAELMTMCYPKRWNIEEFFNTQGALGWNRAATLNLNIRFGRMSLALIAHAVLHELRKKLPDPMKTWSAEQLAQKFLGGIDGDIRVRNDTIVATLYNAPDIPQWRHHYEHLPEKLSHERINPHIPWLYDFKLDFRFK